MSTYQPPGGQPTDGPAPYPQPQDPWGGGEHGLASVPTDPIPQQYGGYTQGDVWSQQTVIHGGQYEQPPPAPKNRAALLITIFVTILLLGGGGGFLAWYLTSQRTDPVTTNPTTPPATTSAKAAFNPNSVKEGDCLLNKAATGAPDISVVACTTAGSFKILKVSKGANIPEGTDGKLGGGTATTECAGTGYNRWYAYDDSDNEKDVFFCLKDN